MKVERTWNSAIPANWKEITEDRAKRELAYAHGKSALTKLAIEGNLKTQHARYRATRDK